MKQAIKSLTFAAFLLAAPAAMAQISLDVGGYLQTWYIADQKTELSSGESIRTNGFRLRRARITARGEISDRYSATIWTDFAGGSNVLLDFHADAHLHPAFNIRMGQFIMPGQSYDTARLVSSRLIFWERAGVSTSLASIMGYDAFRDIGVMVYGRHRSLWYGIHASNGSGRFTQAGTNITERRAGSGLYDGRAELEIISGLTIGGHFSTNQQRDVVERGIGPFDINRTSGSFRVATSAFGLNRLHTQFEYMSARVRDDNRGVITGPDGRYSLDGFYGEVIYELSDEWHVLGRFDRVNQNPAQAGEFVGAESFKRDQITLGMSRYIFHNDREIIRAHLNYAATPGSRDYHIIVLVMQIRFIPL
jgi:hypothetical protein